MHQTKGVDLSEHNGNVDFAALRAAGVEFVLLRLGYGSDYAHQDDARFTENWEKAEAAGLPWGAYLYSYATNTNMAQSEADHALRLLQGKTPLYGVWYDVEDPQISSADVVSTSRTFCSALEEAGYYTGIYASSWTSTTNGWPSGTMPAPTQSPTASGSTQTGLPSAASCLTATGPIKTIPAWYRRKRRRRNRP